MRALEQEYEHPLKLPEMPDTLLKQRRDGSAYAEVMESRNAEYGHQQLPVTGNNVVNKMLVISQRPYERSVVPGSYRSKQWKKPEKAGGVGDNFEALHQRFTDA